MSSEQQRHAVIAGLAILDTPQEAEFDALVEMARYRLDAPIAAISLIDTRRQWFKAKSGVVLSETPREHAFCAHCLGRAGGMIVSDAAEDPRFAANPLVTGEPGIRFYAGVPLRVAASGAEPLAIGALAVIDRRPRIISEEDMAALRRIALVAQALLQARITRNELIGRVAEQQRD